MMLTVGKKRLFNIRENLRRDNSCGTESSEADGSIDCQGDPADQQNVVSRLQQCKVTADGSIECQGDPAEQENAVSRLKHCEVLTALHILAPGGTLVIKIFTMLECKTICLMYLLNCVFKKVEVFKPCTSKAGNSEVYVIGLDFKGRQFCDRFLGIVTPTYFGTTGPTEPEGCLFFHGDIPETFLKQHTECTQLFAEYQLLAIQRNLDLQQGVESLLELQKEFCVKCFFEKYYIRPLPHRLRLMKNFKKRAETKEELMKMEGKFTGSFQERKKLAELPWQQKIYKIQIYEEDVTRKDNSPWIKSFTGCFSKEDDNTFVVTCGRPVTEVYSSRFCSGLYLHQVQEILKHVQWLKEPVTPDSEFMNSVACKLCNVLISTIEYYSNTRLASNDTRANESVETGKAAGCDTDVAGGHALENDVMSETSENRGLPAEEASSSSSTGGRRPQCFFTSDRFRSESLQVVAEECSGGTVSVQLYSVCGDVVTENLDVSQHMDLLHAVLDIVKTSGLGDCAVLEIGTCLTRMSAALIYMLYRSFREIRFVHHHGNLLKRHLVCIDYRGCQVRVQEYLQEVGRMMQTDQSEAVLEIIPVLYLLEDKKFTSFLSFTNENFLKSFITTVINKERMKYPKKAIDDGGPVERWTE